MVGLCGPAFGANVGFSGSLLSANQQITSLFNTQVKPVLKDNQQINLTAAFGTSLTLRFNLCWYCHLIWGVVKSADYPS